MVVLKKCSMASVIVWLAICAAVSKPDCSSSIANSTSSVSYSYRAAGVGSCASGQLAHTDNLCRLERIVHDIFLHTAPMPPRTPCPEHLCMHAHHAVIFVFGRDVA